MSVLFTVFATLSLAVMASACCSSEDTFQIFGKGVQARLIDLKAGLLGEDYFIAYDTKLQRAVVNYTFTNSDRETMVQTLYLDESKESSYEYVLIGENCYYFPLVLGPDISNCLPSNERVLFNFSIGSLNCSIIAYNGTGEKDDYDFAFEAVTIVSDECIPLGTALLYGAFNSTIGYDSEVLVASLGIEYNAQPLQNTDILSPPSICKMATSLETSGIPDDELPFLRVMNRLESFNMFSVLSRLAFYLPPATKHSR